MVSRIGQAQLRTFVTLIEDSVSPRDVGRLYARAEALAVFAAAGVDFGRAAGRPEAADAADPASGALDRRIGEELVGEHEGAVAEHEGWGGGARHRGDRGGSKAGGPGGCNGRAGREVWG